MRVVSPRAVVASDQAFLFTILLNLLSNAVQYTERGRILIGCRRAGERCRIEVYDTGHGITAERLAAITVALSGPDKSTDALGAGLMIVREMATALNHPLRVRALRRAGLCFSVDVPVWNVSR